jgi:uncharacterized protein YkwD
MVRSFGGDGGSRVASSPARASRSLAALLLVLAGGCASRPPAEGPVAMTRRGPGRAEAPYAERERDAKQALLARINADRTAAGLAPVAYDLVAAKAGDAFCLDAARTDVMGHWDLAGRAPYDRFADAGGVDWHAENFSGMTRRGDSFHPGELVGLLLEAHRGMMAEKPPDDGHRRAILDPGWTHVGIGVALEGGEFRMTEEFTRHVATWVEAPAAPVRAGRTAPIALQLPKGWTLGAVEIAHEKFPRTLTPKEIRRRGAYRYPSASRTLLPRLAPGLVYANGMTGEIAVSDGVVRAKIGLDAGPGNYWALVFAAPGRVEGRAMSPIAAVRVVAD